MRQALDLQADRIEQLLQSHRLAVSVLGGVVTPRLLQFRLGADQSVRVASIQRLSEEIALSLGVPSCRVVRRGGALSVEVPRDEPAQVRLLSLCRRIASAPPCTAVLGVSQDGMDLLLRLSSPDVAHVLVAGTTGSGKTELARSMIASLAILNRRSELQLLLIDPKGRGFVAFEGLPHLLQPVRTSVHQALSLLDSLASEMERRDAEGRSEPRVAVFIDELADLLMQGGADMAKVLTRLTQRGRSAGIHVVACTQKPTAAVIGSLVKSNFPVRIVGAVASPEDAKVATGIAGSGAERLLGRGDFLLVARGQVIRFQAARIAEAEIAQMVRVAGPGSRGPSFSTRAAAGQVLEQAARQGVYDAGLVSR